MQRSLNSHRKQHFQTAQKTQNPNKILTLYHEHIPHIMNYTQAIVCFTHWESHGRLYFAKEIANKQKCQRVREEGVVVE